MEQRPASSDDLRARLASELAHTLDAIARADGVLRRVELETGKAIFREILNSGHDGETRRTGRRAPGDVLAGLPWRMKRKLVQLCWLLAESDGTLHAAEEAAIYALADRIGLDRRTVALSQPALNLPCPGQSLAQPVEPGHLSEHLLAAAG
ncbi:MAG: hypothetical protein GVY06_00355 [Alphaproteobacteria bacterium]|jgi:uncharacterized tellurite resistance protein B-like protein|nr:hypothetical protein [Alphaproteobacteria bacterium]